MPELKEGHFITFEGGEGAGKTTQIDHLVRALKAKGYKKIKVFREPGASRIGEAIRSITHDPKNTMLDYRAEALLIAAARAQLVAESYRPLLAEKYIVISDRYVDSSYAYQGFVRGLGYGEVKNMNEFAINGLMPDQTFLLDVPIEESWRRKNMVGNLDRFELEGQAFHAKVRDAFLTLAEQYKGRIICIDGTQSVEHIHQDILTRVLSVIAAE